MIVNDSLRLTKLEDFFYKLTNISDDFRDIQIKRIKKLKREQSESFFDTISTVLDKTLYLLITFLLFGYLYYNFIYVINYNYFIF